MAPGEELEGSWGWKIHFTAKKRCQTLDFVLVLSPGSDMEQEPEELLEQLGVEGVWLGRRNGISWVKNELLLATNTGGSGVCSSQRGKMQTWSSEWQEQLLIPDFRHCSLCLSRAGALHFPLGHS